MSAAARELATRFAATRKVGRILFDHEGTRWGWYANDQYRMHLEVLNPGTTGRVWLETVPGGERTLELDGYVPQELLRPLQLWLWGDGNRERVEAAWASYSVMRGWVMTQLGNKCVHVTVYPGRDTEFARIVELGWHPREVMLHESTTTVVGGKPGEYASYDLAEVLWRWLHLDVVRTGKMVGATAPEPLR